MVHRGSMNTARETFPNSLNGLMANLGLSRSRVAGDLGCSNETIRRYLAGQRFPEIDTLEFLCFYFKCNMLRLIYGNGNAAE